MSALDHLRALARGDPPEDDGLLGNARCAWGRREVIDEEGILAAFCARPLATEDALAVETGQSAALIGAEDALVADLYAGRIGRLWRVGRGVDCPPEPALAVAFDADMRQQRSAVYWRAEDHPELDSAAAERILSAARAHVDEVRRAGSLRVRAFMQRAFGDPDASAALLAVYSLSNAASRSAGFSYAIVGIAAGDETVRLVSEQSQPRSWAPRF